MTIDRCVGGAIYALILVPYVLLIWYILYRRCSVDGEECSYIPNDPSAKQPRHKIRSGVFSVFSLTSKPPKKRCDQVNAYTNNL